MPPRDIRAFLYDVSEAAQLIDEACDNLTFENYMADWVVRSAFERQFEIIGEALNQAIRLDESLERSITSCREIVDFRNRIAHGYYAVKHDVVWNIIRNNLPVLMKEVSVLLSAWQR